MYEIECPYCEHTYELNTDDGHGMEDEELFEETCPKCEKRFVFRSSILWNFYPYMADCLNGGEHDYKPNVKYGDRKWTVMRCSMCETERTLTDEEWEQILKEREAKCTK